MNLAGKESGESQNMLVAYETTGNQKSPPRNYFGIITGCCSTQFAPDNPKLISSYMPGHYPKYPQFIFYRYGRCYKILTEGKSLR